MSESVVAASRREAQARPRGRPAREPAALPIQRPVRLGTADPRSSVSGSPTRSSAIDTAKSIASDQAITGILALAVLIPLAAGGFDLSVAQNLGVSAVVCAALQSKADISPPLAVLITLAMGAGIGMANGFFVARVGVNSFIATLGMTSALVAGSQIVSDQQFVGPGRRLVPERRHGRGRRSPDSRRLLRRRVPAAVVDPRAHAARPPALGNRAPTRRRHAWLGFGRSATSSGRSSPRGFWPSLAGVLCWRPRSGRSTRLGGRATSSRPSPPASSE